LNRIKKFAALDIGQKAVLIQAWFLLGGFRAAILSTSFKRLARSLKHHRRPPDPTPVGSEQLKQAASIGKLVATAARYTPWQSRCLVQVLVVQRLLAKRDIAGQFYLGVRKGGEDGVAPTGLSAHAWLQCDSEIVNGGANHSEYTVVSTFSWGN